MANADPDLLSIGAFSRVTRLSQKALRLYGSLDLLPPAWIDPDSGYRYYRSAQVRDARLILPLRSVLD
jgi:protein phosphatase